MVEIPAVYQGFWGWARGDSPCPAGSGEIKIAAIQDTPSENFQIQGFN